jgi:hypothetical protein
MLGRASFRAPFAITVVSSLVLAACSGGSDSNAPGGDLACAPKQLRVQGHIDDMPVDLDEAASNYVFENKIGDAPGNLTASFATGQLKLEFDKLTPDGGSSDARGFLQETGSALSVGNCETGAFVSSLSISSDGKTIHFALTHLAHEPYCSGASVTGELGGCFAFEK